jgi:hypothetical protein
MPYKAYLTAEKPPGYDDYILANAIYRRASKVFRAVEKRCKGSDDSNLRFQYYEARELWSQQCKVFYKAQKQYAEAQMVHRLKAEGIDPHSLTIAKLAELQTPLTMKQILKEERERKVAESVSPEAFKAIEEAARAYTTKPPKEKLLAEEFLENQAKKNEEDFTNDMSDTF